MAKYRPKPVLLSAVTAYIREKRLADKLREKKPGQLSGLELLERLDKFQEADSPFRSLLKDLRESPEQEEKIQQSVARVLEEAPQRILGRGRRNALHVKRPGQAPEPQPLPEPDPEEEERTKCEMAFLRTVMPPALYQKLCQEMIRQGRMRELGWEVPELPERERIGVTYAEYSALHTAELAEKDGKPANMDEVFTAAAYQLAAFEQKDSEHFDEKKADARAMELSGS